MTEDEFIARFIPERHFDGSIYVQRYASERADADVIAHAKRERRLWTYVGDGSGNAAPVPGEWHVNAEFFIVCEVPYDESERPSVIGDVDYCTICGERFGDVADVALDEVVARSTVDRTECVACVSRV